MNKQKQLKKEKNERLTVERDLEFWAKRYNKVSNHNIKKLIDAEASCTIYKYESQIIKRDYHLNRYERHKRYSRR